MNEKITEIIKEFRKKFYQDTTGEKVEGYLAMKVAYHAADGAQYVKIAIPDDIEAWLTQTLTRALHDMEQEVRNQDIAVVEERDRIVEIIKDMDIPHSVTPPENGYGLALQDVIAAITSRNQE